MNEYLLTLYSTKFFLFRNENEQQISDYQNQIEDLIQERTKILKEMEKETTDGESQTDDDHHEQIVQANSQLKDELQTFQDKVHQVVTEKPNLFDGIGEEFGQRFDHLLSTIATQATQIDALQTERNRVEHELQNQIKELQTYVQKQCYLNFTNHSIRRSNQFLETSQTELKNQNRAKLEQLSSQSIEIRLTIFNHLKQACLTLFLLF